MSRAVAPTPTSPAVLEAEQRLRAQLAAGPVPCHDVTPSHSWGQGVQAQARRRLGVETVRIDGQPHYRLPPEPSS
jgi:hypothetical protein